MFYAFVKMDDPDGGGCDMIKIEGATNLEEAKKIWFDTLFEELKDYSGIEHDEGDEDWSFGLDSLEERWYDEIIFYEVNAFESINIKEEMDKFKSRIKDLIQKGTEKKEREAYKKLKAKYGE